MIGSLMGSKPYRVPCTIEVEKTWETLEAHVELKADVRISPGDEVRVLGEPVDVDFGERIVEEREAEVQHAGPVERSWTKISALMELMELLEFSFTSRRFL